MAGLRAVWKSCFRAAPASPIAMELFVGNQFHFPAQGRFI
jgi:hypothetical protein